MKILLLNQTFHPDRVATAQYLTDAALALARQGHEVSVVAGDRGYDDPTMRFAADETWNGIRIHRVGATKLGKKSRWRRAIDFGTYFLSCTLRVLTLPRHDVVVALTSPPLISVLGALCASRWRARFLFWVMDLNPDEAIAAGWLRPGSLAATALQRLLGYSLRRADIVVALDRFMANRLVAKGTPAARIEVIPPWSLDDAVRPDSVGRDRFRAAHGLEGQFVVMYAGNHSPCNPLDTLVNAAERLQADVGIVFCFLGGGSGFLAIRERASRLGLSNVLCVPYLPLTELAGALSAADLHVVTLGDPFVGILHPSKIYNILRIGSPVLYVGPPESHIMDLAGTVAADWYHAQHGDVDAALAAIRRARDRSSTGVDRNDSSRPIAPQQSSQAFALSRIVHIVTGESTPVATL